jgi:molybdenum cofactor cytidylyltransferase
MDEPDLPVRHAEAFPRAVERPSPSVRGVLLAAGTSSRYGAANKLLQSVEGKPVVRHAAETLVESGLSGVTVVVGHEADRVRAALADLPVAVRTNDEFAAGQSTSVRAGIADAAERDVDAALVALGDMPWVSVGTVDLLVEAYRRGVSDLLVAASDNQRGNPVLFDSRFFDALTDVDGDVGGRALLFEADATAAIETGDAGVVRDVDRPSDLPE